MVEARQRNWKAFVGYSKSTTRLALAVCGVTQTDSLPACEKPLFGHPTSSQGRSQGGAGG